MDVHWCNVCNEFRCAHCRDFTLRQPACEDKKESNTNINEYLQKCQLHIMESTSFWKPKCTHEKETLTVTSPCEIIKAFVTPRQLSIYSKNTNDLLAKTNLSHQNFQGKTVKEVFDLLRVPCLRSFVLSLCMMSLYIDPFAQSICGLFSGNGDDESGLSAKITSVRLNCVDNDYLWTHSRQFLELLSQCLQSCVHLRCTAKASSDSATCGCGVTPLSKVSKAYRKLYSLATAESNNLLHLVHENQTFTHLLHH